MKLFQRVQVQVSGRIYRPLIPRLQDSVLSITPEQPLAYLILAVWFAVFFGLIEVAIIAIRRYALQQVITVGPSVVWTIPLVNIIIFAVPGLFMFVLARIWLKRSPIFLAIFIYAFLGIFSLLTMTSWLYQWAALVLAMGLAAQVARFASLRSQRFFRIIDNTAGVRARTQYPGNSQRATETSNQRELAGRRRVLIGMGAVVAGLAVGVEGWQRMSETRMLNGLPKALPGAPNVLLLVLDTVRAQSLSVLGYSRPTSPQLERLAKTGVSFDNALSTAPWTLPAHASMFTGRYPHELSTGFELPLDDTYPTLAEILAEHGYVTTGFVANTEYCSYEFGLNRGFAHYEDYPVSIGETIRSSSLARMAVHSKVRQGFGNYEILGRKNAAQLNRDFLDWLSRHDRHLPFFAFLNYFDAHDPYLPPKEFALEFATKRPRGHLPPKGIKVPDETVQELNDAYDGSIAYLDHQVGLLFEELNKRNLLENTLVIITSDHGEQFGEHGLLGHANSLYLPLLRVPLIISFPSRVPANVRIPKTATLANMPATVLELIDLREGFSFPGRSLARFWNHADTMSEPVLSEADAGIRQPEAYPTAKGEMRSIVFDGMHYIQNGDGSEELYDIENDPEENHDLAEDAENRSVLAKFQIALKSILKT